MKRALLIRLWIVIAIVMSVCLFSATFLLSSTEQADKGKEMTTQLCLICEIYDKEEQHDYALAEKLSSMVDGARVSFITADGDVFVDTYIEGEPQDDHSKREEVKSAIENGIGVSVRYSDTLGKNQIYAARKASNSDIIRISYNINGFWDFAGIFAGPMLIAALLGIIAGIIVVHNSAKQILKPLKSVSEAMQSMRIMSGEFSESFEEIPPHKYPELDDFIAIFNLMRESIHDKMKTLENERRKERFILDNLADGVLLYDEDLQIVSINKAGFRLLEASDFENGEKGTNIPELIRQPSLIDAANKTVKSDKESSVEITVGGKILIVQMFPVLKSDDRDKCALMVIRDITEKRMSEQLRQDFFANAGHELKTPLTAITGFAELLANGLVPKDKKDYYISKILTEANRMSTIISDILEISALENKTTAEEISDCSVIDICRDVCENMEPAAAAKNVTIKCVGENFTVKAAHKHIYELIENLVSNAVKYNKDGGTVDIELCNVGQIGCIYVKDSGIGIPKEAQSRVFERFYRVDKGRSTKEGSTGLGLSIVKHIVNCYGGTVTLYSELGKGTLFCVRLPISSDVD